MIRKDTKERFAVQAVRRARTTVVWVVSGSCVGKEREAVVHGDERKEDEPRARGAAQ
jgi:hypothetical protein